MSDIDHSPAARESREIAEIAERWETRLKVWPIGAMAAGAFALEALAPGVAWRLANNPLAMIVAWWAPLAPFLLAERLAYPLARRIVRRRGCASSPSPARE